MVVVLARKLYRSFISLFLTALVIFSGCGQTVHIPPRLSNQGQPIIDVHVYVSPDFSEVERANIINGVMMWERATNGLIVWHLVAYDATHEPVPHAGLHNGVESRAVLFQKAVSTDEWVTQWDEKHKPNKHLLGLCQGDSLKELALIWLVEDRLQSSLSQTIIASHEFGHGIGLGHVRNENSTMSELYRWSTNCLTNDDLYEFCKKHGCSSTGLNPNCVTDSP